MALAQAKKTSANNHVRVQANAPYSVKLHSDQGYKMTIGGTPTGNTAHQIGYQVRFLGQTRGGAEGVSDIEKDCPIPGVGTLEDTLYIQARLAEIAASKAPAPNYSDTLTVTITPKAIGSPSTGSSCETLSGTF